jgi:signal transduction histidine kinase
MPPGGGFMSPSEAFVRQGRPRVRFGLATRVLVLITSFVMVAATMIYLPAVAGYRDYWLRNRLSAAYTAALVLEAAPRAMPDGLKRQLLDSVGARIIVLKKEGTKRILAVSEMPLGVDETYDLRDPNFVDSVVGAIYTLTAPPGRVLTLLGEAPMGGELMEITLDEAPLKRGMLAYSRRLLIFTLFMSAIVAGLAVIAINIMVLRPVRRLTNGLIDFGADPENRSRIIIPSGRNHEIGEAERALAVMQDALAQELNQKKHLAALGLAVAKINHDMRNMLASAQLLSDRLANVTDPLAQRLAPKLVATLDRAIRFCQATLAYGRAVDEPPKLRHFALRPLVEEATETVALDARAGIEIVNEVADDFEILGDPEQLFRVIMNLVRNAVEALEQAGPSHGQPAKVTVSAFANKDGQAVIEVVDTGPGVPPAARANLFAAFFNSSRANGSGLGLVIAADLVHAHGGKIMLLEPKEGEGARFRISLPLPGMNGVS